MAPALSADGYPFCPPGVSVTRDKFRALVSDLSKTLGPSSGLTCDDVDLEELTRLAEEYDSNESEWGRYALADYSRGYTRNLVDEGNGKSNLVSVDVQYE